MSTDSVARLALDSCVGDVGLRVEFVRLADRYAHQICVLRNRVRVADLLHSQEGPDGPDADCLPALQSLNIEPLRGGDAAALIGMSGTNHWSLTVEPLQRNGVPGLMFDAACRVRNGPPELISRYAVASGLESAADGQARWHDAAGAYGLQLEACRIADAPPAEIRIGGLEVDVVQAATVADAAGATIRWRYAVTLTTL